MTGWHRGRFYLLDHRVHHGLLGVGLIALGLVLAAEDLSDRAQWFSDLLPRVYPK